MDLNLIDSDLSLESLKYCIEFNRT